ncbi:hypothetical protein, partial [Xanthomonas arboricola]|uniref:hypothetical protein n=1 Tax=Xanthomonas arboricola TaxID=56448 RepID=UPI0006DB1CE8
MSQELDFDKTAEMLLKINDVVGKMDESIRVQTFDLLVSKFLGKQAPLKLAVIPSEKEESAVDDEVDTSDLGAFITSFETKKPADALNVLVAWIFSKRGSQPFSIKEVKELADASGLTIPSRPDMTFKGSKNAGKSLFVQSGKN